MIDGSAAAGLGSRVRLVATDLDGTLLTPGGVVSARTAHAVRGARRAGIHVVPATARPPQAVWDLAAAGGFGPLGVCSNGAALVDLERTEVIETHVLRECDAIEVVTAIRAALTGVHFAVDNLERFAHEPDFFDVSPDWQEELNRIDDVCTVLDERTIQLSARRPGWPAGRLMAVVEPIVGERLAVTTSGLDWIQLAPPLVSKAALLDSVCTRLGVEASEVIAVGDNHNDLAMLAWAGTSMAVANAVPDVLAVVDRTLPSNEDHGVALLLEELVEMYS